MKINAKAPMRDLGGKDIKLEEGIFTVGKALANILVSHEAGGKMKMFVLAQDFYKEKDMELDAADLALVKAAVEGTKSYNALVSGQLLVLLESLKDKATDKK